MPPGNPPPPRTPASGGNPLTRKLGPAPVYVWVAAAAAAYLGYRYLTGGGSAGGGAGVGTSGLGVPSTSNGGGATDSGSSGGGGASPADAFSADMLANLLGDNATLEATLADALVGASSAIAGLGGEALSQLGQLQGSIIGSYTPRDPIVVQVPSPVTVVPAQSPSSGIATVPTPSTTYTSPAGSAANVIPKQVSGTIRFYTYKANVPLAAGQTLRFAAGKGYYAA